MEDILAGYSTNPNVSKVILIKFLALLVILPDHNAVFLVACHVHDNINEHQSEAHHLIGVL